jgi:hypothetical protein
MGAHPARCFVILLLFSLSVWDKDIQLTEVEAFATYPADNDTEIAVNLFALRENDDH